MGRLGVSRRREAFEEVQLSEINDYNPENTVCSRMLPSTREPIRLTVRAMLVSAECLFTVTIFRNDGTVEHKEFKYLSPALDHFNSFLWERR